MFPFFIWVRDSIAHVHLGHTRDYPEGVQGVDWRQPLDWSAGGQLDGIFLHGDDQLGGKRELDVRQLEYNYEYYDYDGATTNFNWANDYERNRKTRYNSTDFVKKTSVRIYPGTFVWNRDVYNPRRGYFWNPTYNNYPVVGIAYYQAKASCDWRTNYMKKQLKLAGYEGYDFEFRLPIEAEWEYAAIAQPHYPTEPINIKAYPTFP